MSLWTMKNDPGRCFNETSCGFVARRCLWFPGGCRAIRGEADDERHRGCNHAPEMIK